MGRNPARSGLVVIFPRGRAGVIQGPLATMTTSPDRETMGSPEVVKPGQKEIRHD